MNPTSSLRFETSISLILLSCYVTLLRISTVVLEHFQDYLLAHSSTGPNAPSVSGAQGSIVCLGDLDLPHQSQNRVHTAIHILLGSLEEVENALCLPSQVRDAILQQSSVVSASGTPDPLFTEPVTIHLGILDAGDIRCILNEFGQKFRNIKSVLRHLMDL